MARAAEHFIRNNQRLITFSIKARGLSASCGQFRKWGALRYRFAGCLSGPVKEFNESRRFKETACCRACSLGLGPAHCERAVRQSCGNQCPVQPPREWSLNRPVEVNSPQRSGISNSLPVLRSRRSSLASEAGPWFSTLPQNSVSLE